MMYLNPSLIPTVIFIVSYIICIIITLLIIPNRNFQLISLEEIDRMIKNINMGERISFYYKGVKISLKRVKDKLIIEPYSSKLIELLFRHIGFIVGFFMLCLFAFLIISLIGLSLNFLLNIPNENVTNGFGNIGEQLGDSKSFYIVVFIFSFLIGKFFRKKVLNKLLVLGCKNEWEEFYKNYNTFKF